MEIRRNGSVPTRRGPASAFTGTVWQEPVASAPAPAMLKANLVTFEPGARTAWHTHPMGQTLYVTGGSGLIQVSGGRAEVIRPGDAVWIPPGEKHWHGARPANAMTHLAMQESPEGEEAVEWLEPVSDAEYREAGENAA
jgi:quercetin dioxygenase-like cupin family protein